MRISREKRQKKGGRGTASTTSTHQTRGDHDIQTSKDSVGQWSEGDVGRSEVEKYESKVKQAMDLALEKSVHTRTNALLSLTTALQKRVLTVFLMDDYKTCDLSERSIKKGRGPEQAAAARLGTVLVITLMGKPEATQVYKTLCPVLTLALTDPSGPLAGRLECAWPGVCLECAWPC